MSYKKKILQILCLLLCGAGIYWALKDQNFNLLQALSLQNIFCCSGFIICGYFFSGLQYYFVLRKMGCQISKADILLFPFMQSFWGMVIPFQGSAMFAMFYLKKRYSFQVNQSITMILFLYMLNVLFASIAGIWYSLNYMGWQTLLFALSIIALFSPVYCFIAHKILQRYGKIPYLPQRLNDMLRSFFSDLHNLLTDWKNILQLLGCQMIRQICFAFFFVKIARVLNQDVPWLWGYFITVSQDLTIILKLTPCNVGVVEMVSGLVSALTGIPAAVGINASLFNTLLQMILILLIGGLSSLFILGRGFNPAKQPQNDLDK